MGQPANGWRKDRNGRATFTTVMRMVSFKQQPGMFLEAEFLWHRHALRTRMAAALYN